MASQWYTTNIVHEFSITQTIVQAVLAELRKVQPSRLVRARIVAGGLHQLVNANLAFAYKVLTKETPAAGSRLSIRRVPITAECRQCHWRGKIKGALFVCGKCQAGDIEITGGRELYLDSIEVEKDEGLVREPEVRRKKIIKPQRTQRSQR